MIATTDRLAVHYSSDRSGVAVERDGRRRCPRDGALLTVDSTINGEEWSCLCGYRWYGPGRQTEG